MITKRTAIDLIQVLEDGIMQIREATIIEEDGVELARTFHRHCKVPGEDCAEEDSKVIAIASAVHTVDVVEAYEAKLNAIESDMLIEKGLEK